MKRKFFKAVILTICLAFVAGLFAGCDFGAYKGKYADLYTVAINSVLWNRGHSYGADHYISSEIEIIERDEYGRTLYKYLEGFYTYPSNGYYALIVSQYVSHGWVYYYEDCNYIVRELPPPQAYDRQAIEQLKEANDWGKPVDADKCIRKRIVKKKPQNEVVANIVTAEVKKEYSLSDGVKIYTDYLTDDEIGNGLYYGAIGKSDDETDFFVAFVSADGNIKLFTPSNIFDYNEQLKTFKKENGWVS